MNAYPVLQKETSIILDRHVAARIRSFPGFGLSVALYHGSARYLSNLAWVSGTLRLEAERSPDASSLQQKNTAIGLYFPLAILHMGVTNR